MLITNFVIWVSIQWLSIIIPFKVEKIGAEKSFLFFYILGYTLVV